MQNKIRSLVLTAVAATFASGLALPALASGAVKLDAQSEAKLRQKLTGEGYEVRSVGTEDGYYEVYARKDGKRYEMYFDGDFNLVKSN